MRQLMVFFAFSLSVITAVQAQEVTVVETPATPTEDVLNMPSNWEKLKNEKRIRFLFAAVQRGDLTLAQSMLADVNLPFYEYNTDGETLLTLAISEGRYEMVKWLCEDAVINLENEAGETPLTLAIKKQNPAITALVLKRAKADLANKRDETPLMLAISYAYEPAFIHELLSRGAQPNRLSNGITPLSKAVDNENIQLAAMLIRKGADTSLPNTNGHIPLYQAVRYNHAVLAGILLHRSPQPGIDANWHTPVGETLINMAVSHQNTTLVRVLAEAGADVNAVDYLENTPLHMAAERGMTDAVTVLLAHGAMVDLPNIMGTTPIMAAAQNGYENMAVLLANAGANPAQRDYSGIAANDYGEYQGYFSDPFLQQEVNFLLEEID